MRARLDNILGLRRTTSRDSLVSLAGSINTKRAYKKLVKDLFAIGVTAGMINDKEKEIKGLFGPQQAAASNTMDHSTPGNQDHQLLEVGDSSNVEASPIPTTFGNQSQLPEVGNSSGAEASPISPLSTLKSRSRFDWVLRPPIDFLVGPRMLAAAEAGDTQLLISTLRYVRNINFAGDRKQTALHKAATRGHKDVVQLLLTNGALLDATDDVGDTPLHDAARRGHTSTVELLLTNGASVEDRDGNESTPLHKAAVGGHTSTVELLLTKGASVEATNWNKATPLHLAVMHHSTRTVELLLAKGASIAARNGNNNTPLHLAVMYNSTRTVELLLAKGAPIEAINRHYETPLDLATSCGYTDIMKLLESKAAEPLWETFDYWAESCQSVQF